MNNVITENNIDDLDLTWIQEFENLDNEYKSYYTEELSFIRIHSIYVNTNNDIEKIKEEKIMLKTPGFLQKDELLGIIKHNSFLNQIKYKLLSILKFNINLEPINLKTFLRSKDKNIGSLFLQSIKNIDTIRFDKSIAMFQDINDLIIVFHEKINNQLGSIQKNYTKKIYIKSTSNKKTKRNELKDLAS
jgi:hypothetical protein